MSFNSRLLFGQLQVVLLAVFAPVGLLVIVLPNLLRLVWMDVWLWTVVWVVPSILALLSDFFRHDVSGFASTLLAGTFFMVVGVTARVSRLTVKAGVVPFGFCVGLWFLLLAAVCQIQIDSSTWFHPDQRVVTLPSVFVWDQWRLHGLVPGDFVRRSWLLPAEANEVRASLEVRAVERIPDQWVKSDGRIQLAQIQEDGEVFSRVGTPLGIDPFLAWTFDTGQSLGGRTFRVSLEMRSPDPFPKMGCRGVWLQEDGGAYHTKCQAVALQATWKRIQLNWRAPEESTSSRIRIVLNDFDGLDYDVRRVRLEERQGLGWTSISSSWLWLGTNFGTFKRVNLNLGSAWKSLQVVLDVPPLQGAKFEAVIGMGSGTLEVRRMQVFAAGRSLESVRPLPRISLWFAQPNFLGHSAAVLLLCGLALSQRGWLNVFLVLGGLVLIAFTGSRTALLGAVVGVPLLIIQSLSVRARLVSFVAFVVIVALLLVFAQGIRRDATSLFVDGNLTPRTQIWQIAWMAMMDYPFGLGDRGFSAYFEQLISTVPHEAIQHAHNFWLDLGVRYGLLGLIAAGWISVGLLFLAWGKARWVGLSLLGAIYLMNITDNTLLFQGVLFPLVLTLNSLNQIPFRAVEKV
jgi:hypothetical protein